MAQPSTPETTATTPDQSEEYKLLIVKRMGYDAIKDAVPNQEYSFSTKRSKTQFFNLSQENIEESETKALVELFEDSASKDNQVKLKANLINDGASDLTYTISPKVENHRYMIVLAPETPLYLVRPGVYRPDQGAAYTLTYPTKDAVVIIVRGPSKNNHGQDRLHTAKEQLYTEICQSAYQVQPSPKDAAKYKSDIKLLGQEDICTSAGEALVFAARGATYQQYKQANSKLKLRVPGVGVANQIVANKNSYLKYQEVVK